MANRGRLQPEQNRGRTGTRAGGSLSWKRVKKSPKMLKFVHCMEYNNDPSVRTCWNWKCSFIHIHFSGTLTFRAHPHISHFVQLPFLSQSKNGDNERKWQENAKSHALSLYLTIVVLVLVFPFECIFYVEFDPYEYQWKNQNNNVKTVER